MLKDISLHGAVLKDVFYNRSCFLAWKDLNASLFFPEPSARVDGDATPPQNNTIPA